MSKKESNPPPPLSGRPPPPPPPPRPTMTDKYYVIRNSDGDTHIDERTKKEILAMLEERKDYTDPPEIMAKIDSSDTNYWGDGFLIIKGNIVTPTEKSVVTEYDIV